MAPVRGQQVGRNGADDVLVTYYLDRGVESMLRERHAWFRLSSLRIPENSCGDEI